MIVTYSYFNNFFFLVWLSWCLPPFVEPTFLGAEVVQLCCALALATRGHHWDISRRTQFMSNDLQRLDFEDAWTKITFTLSKNDVQQQKCSKTIIHPTVIYKKLGLARSRDIPLASQRPHSSSLLRCLRCQGGLGVSETGHEFPRQLEVPRLEKHPRCENHGTLYMIYIYTYIYIYIYI